jgi:hypothetical protein
VFDFAEAKKIYEYGYRNTLLQIESLKLDDMKLDVKINKLDDRIKRLEQVMNNLAILLSEVQHGKR